MPTIAHRTTVSIGGISIQGNANRTAEGQIGQEVTVAAAKAGTLSTRTDDDTGTLTLESGHGITDSDVIDIYWDGGVAYGATVGTVSGTSVPFDTPSGDALPSQDTAITACVRQVIDIDVDADLIAILAMYSSKRGHADIQDSVGTELAVELPAGEPWSWIKDQGVANPLDGDTIDAIHVSNGDSTAATTFKLGLLYDSVS